MKTYLLAIAVVLFAVSCNTTTNWFVAKILAWQNTRL